MKKALIKRAPLVIIVLGVLFAWQGGFGLWPVERTITWRLWGSYGTIRRVDLQLYDGEQLLQRTELLFAKGATAEPTSKISLKAGSYPTKVLLWREGIEQPEIHTAPLVADATATQIVVP